MHTHIHACIHIPRMNIHEHGYMAWVSHWVCSEILLQAVSGSHEPSIVYSSWMQWPLPFCFCCNQFKVGTAYPASTKKCAWLDDLEEQGERERDRERSTKAMPSSTDLQWANVYICAKKMGRHLVGNCPISRCPVGNCSRPIPVTVCRCVRLNRSSTRAAYCWLFCMD